MQVPFTFLSNSNFQLKVQRKRTKEDQQVYRAQTKHPAVKSALTQAQEQPPWTKTLPRHVSLLPSVQITLAQGSMRDAECKGSTNSILEFTSLFLRITHSPTPCTSSLLPWELANRFKGRTGQQTPPSQTVAGFLLFSKAMEHPLLCTF